jgi:hypothetical protein
MNNDKICMLCAGRRCGSQYAAELIAKNLGYTNLYEPFTGMHAHTIHLQKNNATVLIKNPYMNEIAEDRLKRVLSILKLSSNKVILKYFVGELDETQEFFLINSLRDLGFTFILNKRQDIEMQLLSYAVASSTNLWHKTKKTIINHNNIQVDKLIVNKVYTQIKIFDERIKLLNLYNLDTITYETSIPDIERIFECYIDESLIHLQKIIDSTNPYNNISNATEIKKFIESIIT